MLHTLFGASVIVRASQSLRAAGQHVGQNPADGQLYVPAGGAFHSPGVAWC